MIATQVYTFVKTHQTEHVKLACLIVYELYLNEVYF